MAYYLLGQPARNARLACGARRELVRMPSNGEGQKTCAPMPVGQRFGESVKKYYVSPDTRIPVRTMNEMAHDADKNGWKFIFSDDKKKVVVTWWDDDIETFELERA
jgi:hypothetical protein